MESSTRPFLSLRFWGIELALILAPLALAQFCPLRSSVQDEVWIEGRVAAEVGDGHIRIVDRKTELVYEVDFSNDEETPRVEDIAGAWVLPEDPSKNATDEAGWTLTLLILTLLPSLWPSKLLCDHYLAPRLAPRRGAHVKAP